MDTLGADTLDTLGAIHFGTPSRRSPNSPWTDSSFVAPHHSKKIDSQLKLNVGMIRQKLVLCALVFPSFMFDSTAFGQTVTSGPSVQYVNGNVTWIYDWGDTLKAKSTVKLSNPTAQVRTFGQLVWLNGDNGYIDSRLDYLIISPGDVDIPLETELSMPSYHWHLLGAYFCWGTVHAGVVRGFGDPPAPPGPGIEAFMTLLSKTPFAWMLW